MHVLAVEDMLEIRNVGVRSKGHRRLRIGRNEAAAHRCPDVEKPPQLEKMLRPSLKRRDLILSPPINGLISHCAYGRAFTVTPLVRPIFYMFFEERDEWGEQHRNAVGWGQRWNYCLVVKRTYKKAKENSWLSFSQIRFRKQLICGTLRSYDTYLQTIYIMFSFNKRIHSYRHFTPPPSRKKFLKFVKYTDLPLR